MVRMVAVSVMLCLLAQPGAAQTTDPQPTRTAYSRDDLAKLSPIVSKVFSRLGERWLVVACSLAATIEHFDAQKAMVISIDTVRHERITGGYRVWERSDYVTTQTMPTTSFHYDYFLAHVEVNCAALSQRYLAATYYSLDGRTTDASDFQLDEGKWSEVPPDSTGEIAVRALCRYLGSSPETAPNNEGKKPGKPPATGSAPSPH